MLADLDESIRQLIVAELPIKNGEIDIKFDQPKREWSARLTKPTINFYLYDLRENVVLRQHQWQQLPTKRNGTPNLARMKRTPFRLDCHYMLTAWAAEPEDEHRLMTRCLMALFRNPIMPEKYLIGHMQGQQFEIQSRVASHDKLTNPAEVWSALDNEMRPSVSFLITVALDPWQPVTGPIVRTFTLRRGQAIGLPHTQQLDPDGMDLDMTYIGGTVRDKDQSPQAGLEIAIQGTGFLDTTDEKGRYTLGGLTPGEYTLVVWPKKGRPVRKQITLPSEDGDYDVEL